VMRWWNVPTKLSVSLLLGPCVIQALLAICVGVSVVAGVPLKRTAIPVCAGLFALAVYGAWTWRRSDPVERRTATILLAVSALVVPLVMLPYFVYGIGNYPGSGFLDGWSYAAFGQYLWEYPRDTEGGLAPLYQYAVHLGHTRFAASGQLGLVSLMVGAPGDTQFASDLVRGLSIFSLASACAAFALVRQLSPRRAILYVGLAVVSGWVMDVVWANNYDHGLALLYFPALATLALCLPEAWSLGSALLTSVVAAGALYTYPEFALLALGSAGLLVIEAAIARRSAAALGRVAFVGIVTALLAAPYARDFSKFIVIQLTSGLSNNNRPGAGMFPGLLESHHRVSALVALGGERLADIQPRLQLLIASVVLLTIAVGLIRWLWQRQFGLTLIAGGLITLIALMIWRQQYDYGAYKFLSLGWWLFAFAAISGITWLADALGPFRIQAWALAVPLVALVPGVTVARAVFETVHAPDERMEQYRVIEELPRIIGHAPVLLDVAQVNSEHWGVYFLRRTDVILGLRNGYLSMAHLVRLLDRSEAVAPGSVRYVITDASIDTRQVPAHWRLVWGVGRYAVWDTSTQGWAAVTRIHDALGNDVQFQPYLYIGPPGATISVLASRPGTLAFSTKLFNLFSSTDQSCWQLRLTTTTTTTPQELSLRPGAITLDLPIPAGASTITLLANPARPTSFSVTPERAREGSLRETTAILLPTDGTRAGTDGTGAAGTVHAPSYTACDAS
jgi:hypothetical protein